MVLVATEHRDPRGHVGLQLARGIRPRTVARDLGAEDLHRQAALGMPTMLVRFTKRAEKTRMVCHSMRLRPPLMALIATDARLGTTVLDLEDSISMALVGGCGMKVIIMWILGSLRTRGAACGRSRRTILGDAAAVTAL
jgi:hypothetical protein